MKFISCLLNHQITFSSTVTFVKTIQTTIFNNKRYFSNGMNIGSIIDIPSDHEKHQDRIDIGIDYNDYRLDKNLDYEYKTDYYLQSHGVFHTSQLEDVQILVENYSSPALARALRERENTLQIAAELAKLGDITKLREILLPFDNDNIIKTRIKKHRFDIYVPITRKELVIFQRYIHRIPRQLSPRVERRASVVIPLCNRNGIPSMLFEKRSNHVRTYKNEVCFPGGMLDEGQDGTIIQTALRELEEELGVTISKTEVLGILRCNWNEVASMTGISVTPVIGFIGEYEDLQLNPNEDEVSDLFTIPIHELLKEEKWVREPDSISPVYTGGPYIIWGLTAYLLDRFLKDIIEKCMKKA